MKVFNLTGAAARLDMALQDLTKAVEAAGETWSDEAYRRFRETYIAPLSPKMRDTLEAIMRLDQTLQEAERACGDRM